MVILWTYSLFFGVTVVIMLNVDVDKTRIKPCSHVSTPKFGPFNF